MEKLGGLTMSEVGQMLNDNIAEAHCCVIRKRKSFLSNSRNIDVIQQIRTFRLVGLRQLKQHNIEQLFQLTKTHGSKRPDSLYYIYVA